MNSREEADKGERDFTTSTDSVYRMATCNITLWDRYYDRTQVETMKLLQKGEVQACKTAVDCARKCNEKLKNKNREL
jgi:hypothetical protein